MADDNLPLELVGWKGFSTLKAYVNGECRLHYLRLLGVDVSQFGNFPISINNYIYEYINYFECTILLFQDKHLIALFIIKDNIKIIHLSYLSF